MLHYDFDGSLTGLLSCVFRAFEFKEWDSQLLNPISSQNHLFSSVIKVKTDEIKAQRVWEGLKKKLSSNALKKFHYAFLSENLNAHQALLNYCVFIFKSGQGAYRNYNQVSVLEVEQWAKKVSREKHRMEAFVRFKKLEDELYLSLVNPDFNVLPIIEKHFVSRYQDQRWLIYDEKRLYGIYYDLNTVHQVFLNAAEIDDNLKTGCKQQFSVPLYKDEALYDQLWKTYFNSVNIVERQNMRFHIQYVPKRYWRYLNEKDFRALSH